jgi:hypothetical protein
MGRIAARPARGQGSLACPPSRGRPRILDPLSDPLSEASGRPEAAVRQRDAACGTAHDMVSGTVPKDPPSRLAAAPAESARPG